jgi:hypothetical protein
MQVEVHPIDRVNVADVAESRACAAQTTPANPVPIEALHYQKRPPAWSVTGLNSNRFIRINHSIIPYQAFPSAFCSEK